MPLAGLAHPGNHLGFTGYPRKDITPNIDAQVGRIIESLKKNKLYDNTLIVCAADHGEAFYQHGYPSHGTSQFDDQVRTFAIFKLPGSTRRQIRTDAISLIDINPTILEILGLPNHPNFQGQQILESHRKGPIYLLSHGIVKSHGIVDGPWKFISSQKDGELLFNLAKDPAETTNLARQNPAKLSELRQRLSAYERRQFLYYLGLPKEDRSRFYPPRHFEFPESIPPPDHG